MMKKTWKIQSFVIILIFSFITMLTACSADVVQTSTEPVNVQNEVKTSVNEDLVIHYIDVGQADSILIQNGNESMLIDGGNNDDGDMVAAYIKELGIEKIDYVIGTHPHEDHIGGLDTVINAFEVERVYMPKVTHTSKTFKDLVTAIKSKGLKVTVPVAGTTFQVGEAEAVILAPNSSEYEDLNNYSIVMKLNYGNTSYLFTGDAEDLSEKEMIDKGFDLSANVLKIGHHGSHSSTTADFLQKINPKYAVIMVGNGNDYGHPHKEIMDLLKEKGITVYRTDQEGTIVLTSDGENINFNKSSGDYSSTKEGLDSGKTDTAAGKALVDESGNNLIKGNINSKGEKIYHVAGGAYYDQVQAEMWFKTEEEAIAAGFRKSKR